MQRHVSGPARAVVLALVLTGCAAAGTESGGATFAKPAPPSAPQPGATPPPADPARAAGWQRVAVGGSIRTIFGVNSIDPHLLAAGEIDGTPLLVDIADGEARTIAGDFPREHARGLGPLATDGASIAVAEEVQAGSGRPATLWLGDEDVTYSREVPRDREGREPGWLSPLLDGEEDYRSVGAVRRPDGQWVLHAWQAWEEWEPLDSADQLFVQGTPTSATVLTGTTETTVVVAGAVADRPSAGPLPQVWSIHDTADFSHGRWQRHELLPAADGLTDVAYWDLGWWVAGYSALRPLVYDFNEGDGASLPVPDTRLDPRHPAVLVAEVPVTGPMVLATQSEDGPTVWVGEGTDWERIPAPPGRVNAAERVGDGVYVLVEGNLWFRSIPGLQSPAVA